MEKKVHNVKESSVRDKKILGLSQPHIQLRRIKCVQKKDMPNPAWESSGMALKVKMGLEMSLQG